MHVAQPLGRFRAAQYVHAPQGVTEPPAQFHAQHAYITGFDFFREKHLVDTFTPFFGLVDFRPVPGIVGNLYLVRFAVCGFPVQAHAAYRLFAAKVYANPFVVGTDCRPTGVVLAVGHKGRFALVSRRGVCRTSQGKNVAAGIELELETLCRGVGRGVDGGLLAVASHGLAVHIVYDGFGRQSVVVFCGRVGHFHFFGHGVPIDMYRLTSLLASEVCSREVVIVVVGLPYHAGIRCAAHPKHDSRGVVPHMVEPALEESLVAFIAHPLRLRAEFPCVLRAPVALLDDRRMPFRPGIESRRAEIVEVPHFVDGP